METPADPAPDGRRELQDSKTSRNEAVLRERAFWAMRLRPAAGGRIPLLQTLPRPAVRRERAPPRSAARRRVPRGGDPRGVRCPVSPRPQDSDEYKKAYGALADAVRQRLDAPLRAMWPRTTPSSAALGRCFANRSACGALAARTAPSLPPPVSRGRSRVRGRRRGRRRRCSGGAVVHESAQVVHESEQLRSAPKNLAASSDPARRSQQGGYPAYARARAFAGAGREHRGRVQSEKTRDRLRIG